MTGASGNSTRARTRVTSTFAPRWKVWAWCWARGPHECRTDRRGDAKVVRPRCQFPRRHHGRHVSFDGFDVRYFDTTKEGTP